MTRRLIDSGGWRKEEKKVGCLELLSQNDERAARGPLFLVVQPVWLRVLLYGAGRRGDEDSSRAVTMVEMNYVMCMYS